MRDTTAFVFSALIAGAAWVLHHAVKTWGEVRRARVETDNIHARAELERASHRPPAQRGRPAEPDQGSGLSPMSNVRITSGE
jgi:hypothetical protein